MVGESRTALYNRIMSARDELSRAQVEELGAEIGHRVLRMEEWRTSLRVGLYAAFKNEVRTELLFREGDKHRKEMYYPAVDAEGGGQAYFRVTRLDDLCLTEAGMRQPSAKQSRLRDINTLNLLIVPGVAFDLHGGRMGLGQGFHDKCLLAFRGKRVALAYDFQVVPDLPAAVRGRKVDWIVTEKRLIRCQ